MAVWYWREEDRSMKQHTEIKPYIYGPLICLQNCQDSSVVKEESFQQMMWGHLDVHMQKN